MSARRPWHASARLRVALALTALLALAAAAAFALGDQSNGDPSGLQIAAPGDAATLVEVGQGSGAAAIVRDSSEATPTSEPMPTPALVEVQPAEVTTGETVLLSVSAPHAVSAAMEYGGQVRGLSSEVEGHFFAMLGVPLDAVPGAHSVTVRLTDAAGLVEEHVTTITVTPDVRPLDPLDLTAPQASVLTAEAAATEARLRSQQFVEYDSGRMWDGRLLMPVEGLITTLFGQRRSYNGGPVGSYHTGTDLAAAEGTPVLASAAGRVDWTGEMPIRGNSVLLDHGAGVKTGYHHLQQVLVAPGALVQPGEVIGYLGSTGLSTGPHLHWELTIWGVNVDPMTWTQRDFTPTPP